MDQNYDVVGFRVISSEILSHVGNIEHYYVDCEGTKLNIVREKRTTISFILRDGIYFCNNEILKWFELLGGLQKIYILISRLLSNCSSDCHVLATHSYFGDIKTFMLLDFEWKH